MFPNKLLLYKILENRFKKTVLKNYFFKTIWENSYQMRPKCMGQDFLN